MTPSVKTLCAGFGIAALAAVGTGAYAQTTVPPGTPDRPHRTQSAPAQRPGSTSETLGQAHGVLKPPRTGDSNVIPPKNPSRTPTPDIAPPGTPGGNPNVVPK